MLTIKPANSFEPDPAQRPSVPLPPPPSIPPRTNQEHPPFNPPPTSNPVVNRYADAYRTANLQVGIGKTIKVVSVLFGGGVALLSLANSRSLLGAAFGLIGIVAGITLGLLGVVIGLLISAQGQLTRATLDTAVNTSPFLSNDDRARMMSL